ARFQMIETAFAVFAKAVVIPNHQYLRVKRLYKHIRNKGTGGKARKFFGKRDNEQVVDAEAAQLFNALFYGRKQFEVVILREEHQARMGPVGNDHTLPSRLPGTLFHALQNLLVAHMHPIEGAAGDHRKTEMRKVGYITNYFHSLPVGLCVSPEYLLL